jgi:hypothetical protein
VPMKPSIQKLHLALTQFQAQMLDFISHKSAPPKTLLRLEAHDPHDLNLDLASVVASPVDRQISERKKKKGLKDRRLTERLYVLVLKFMDRDNSANESRLHPPDHHRN